MDKSTNIRHLTEVLVGSQGAGPLQVMSVSSLTSQLSSSLIHRLSYIMYIDMYILSMLISDIMLKMFPLLLDHLDKY